MRVEVPDCRLCELYRVRVNENVPGQRELVIDCDLLKNPVTCHSFIPKGGGETQEKPQTILYKSHEGKRKGNQQ